MYYVAAKAENFYKQALKDDSENRVLAAQRNLQQTVDLLMDVDRLLASHPLYRLEEWVELARNSGTTLQEKDAYEANAKRLITSWGGIQEDYAARFWSGLIKDYYTWISNLFRHLRMVKLCEAVLQSAARLFDYFLVRRLRIAVMAMMTPMTMKIPSMPVPI